MGEIPSNPMIIKDQTQVNSSLLSLYRWFRMWSIALLAGIPRPRPIFWIVDSLVHEVAIFCCIFLSRVPSAFCMHLTCTSAWLVPECSNQAGSYLAATCNTSEAHLHQSIPVLKSENHSPTLQPILAPSTLSDGSGVSKTCHEYRAAPKPE